MGRKDWGETSRITSKPTIWKEFSFPVTFALELSGPEMVGGNIKESNILKHPFQLFRSRKKTQMLIHTATLTVISLSSNM